jgi:hypothetical protein
MLTALWWDSGEGVPANNFRPVYQFFNEILDDNFEIILKINCPVSTISIEYFPV